mgnify:CR=1 FL=1
MLQALEDLGIGVEHSHKIGLRLLKVGMPWPLEKEIVRHFAEGLEEILVVEEKRGIIESQLKEYFYDWPGHKPGRMVGKHRAAGDPLLPWTGELSPLALVPVAWFGIKSGLWLQHRVNERLFYRLVVLAMAVVGVQLIVKALGL